ncbi:MAG: serine hydrolase [Patescibacteria group bacterium]
MEQIQNKKYLYIFIIVCVLLQAVLFSFGNFKVTHEFNREEKKFTQMQNALVGVNVEAKAFSVYDITTNKEIYGKNQNMPFPLASLVKTMTVLAVLDKKNLDEVVSISHDAISQKEDSGLFRGEKWKMGDLARLTLISSANDGAYALSETDENILEKMNAKAKRLGMHNTNFLNATGLDIDKNTVGAYGSAFDMNIMASFALKALPEIFHVTTLSEITLTSDSGFVHNVKNTDTITEKIPNILFSKTGYTDITGGNLSIIFKNKNGHDIAITVLGSTFLGRFSDMENLVNALYNLNFEN